MEITMGITSGTDCMPVTADRVVLSFSGGLDSTSLLLDYLSKGKTVTAVSFKYGQNHQIELNHAKKIIKLLAKWGYPVEHEIIDLTSAFSRSASSLVKGGIPEGHYQDETMKSTVVENRNVIFSSIIFGMALSISKENDCDVIIAQAVHAGDHTIYPDCRPESMKMARELYKISNWGSERIDFQYPFVNFSKSDVLRVGLLAARQTMKLTKQRIKKIYALTWSCYNPDENGKPCGKCGTCVERAEAFADNDMQDPALD